MSRTAQQNPLPHPSLAGSSRSPPSAQQNPRGTPMAEQPCQRTGADAYGPSNAAPNGSLPHSLASSDGDDALPTSVRGAPPELRRIIRKRQNSESAKRCRQRKKIESARTADEIMTQAAKLQRLEAVVAHLSRRLDETQAILGTLAARAGHPVPALPRRFCPHRHPQCAGAECALCVRALHAAVSPPPPPPPPQQPQQQPPQQQHAQQAMAFTGKVDEDAGWTHVGHAAAGLPAAAGAPSRAVAMQQMPVAQDIAAHTKQLQIVLGERQPEDAGAGAQKVEEIEGGAWQ